MDAFYGVIAGSIISLAGVLITLRWNQKLHEMNLKEERRKIKEEREFSSKRDAFLSAFEALSRYIYYYISVPDRILPSDGTISEEVVKCDITFNRLHCYCELETIEELTRLDQILYEAWVEVVKAKLPSAFTDVDIKDIEVRISGIEKINTGVQDEITVMLQSNPENPLLESCYNKKVDNLQQIRDLLSQRTELIKRRYEETEKCRDVVAANLKNINESLRDILLLARRELSFAIEHEKYRTITDKKMKSMERISKGFLAECRRQMQERMQ